MPEAHPSPLAGKRIVVTRAAEQSAPLVKALQQAGAKPALFPLIEFAAPEDFAPLDAALHQLPQFDWLFLTSQNALRALIDRSRSLDIPLAEAAQKLLLAVVGPATAEAAAKSGLRVAHVASKHNGLALAQELAAEVQGRHVLLPRSDRGNPDLVTALQELGARVTEVVAYRTVLPANPQWEESRGILRGDFDAILFFSPSAVHNFQELLGLDDFRNLATPAAFVAIGPVTAGALRAAGVPQIISASDTTVTAVLDALTEFFAGAGRNSPAGVQPA